MLVLTQVASKINPKICYFLIKYIHMFLINASVIQDCYFHDQCCSGDGEMLQANCPEKEPVRNPSFQI